MVIVSNGSDFSLASEAKIVDKLNKHSKIDKLFNIFIFLIIDPYTATGELFKKWQSELYDLPKEQVIIELRKMQILPIQ